MKSPKLFVLICILGLQFFVTDGWSQNGEADLRAKRISIKAESQSLGNVLEHLMRKHDVAVGFEESSLDRVHDDYDFATNLNIDKPETVNAPGSFTVSVTAAQVFDADKNRITLHFENARLEEVFNEIVKQMKNYTWDVKDNVVNIFPTRGRDDRFQKLLELRIRSFDLPTKKAYVGMIKNQVNGLPEIVSFLSKENLRSNRTRTGLTDYLFRKLPRELHFSDLTVRELLNKITAEKRGGWIVRQGDKTDSQGVHEIDIDI